ncbi:unnamed protein product [Microthlaspi erraticum]|uniref:Reverse transcriptase zinc-binding domain-containing protein n=1 Tax=Microthlaspi erraticum TaxID=1685480 RepID=A0A6D2JXT8_9BRAS|nr:unnamed protein product [Microthlaspi erraticum]CAA7046647.1 unnamed protein product [Microthlaspi erraticum]
MFRKVLKLRPKVLSFLSIKIGNGENSFFWWDPWTPFGSLINFLGSQGPANLGIPLHSLVKDYISGDGWILPPARSDLQVEVFSYISSITPSLESDTPIWKVDDQIMDSFVAKVIWGKIRLSKPEVLWHPLVWNKIAVPKHATTSWLFMLDRNPTLNRLQRWGLDVEPTCLLCGMAQESRDHLFFLCPFSNHIWLQLMHRIRLTSVPSTWLDIVSWLSLASSSIILSLAKRQDWQACIYEIWKERNRRFHDGITLSSHKIFHKILCLLINKSLALRNFGSSRGEPLLRLWSSGSLQRGR